MTSARPPLSPRSYHLFTRCPKQRSYPPVSSDRMHSMCRSPRCPDSSSRSRQSGTPCRHMPSARQTCLISPDCPSRFCSCLPSSFVRRFERLKVWYERAHQCYTPMHNTMTNTNPSYASKSLLQISPCPMIEREKSQKVQASKKGGSKGGSLNPDGRLPLVVVLLP